MKKRDQNIMILKDEYTQSDAEALLATHTFSPLKSD